MTTDWKLDFNTYMSSALGYVVLEIDGAGSSGQGQTLMGAVRRRLGHWEVKDQIAAVKHVVGEFKFVDGDRVAVSGVSYGGYVAGMILSERQNVEERLFKCGVAVAPVVDWRFYGRWNKIKAR